MERHRHPSSLAAAFDPQRNALAMLRLGLAGLVAVTHATQIGFGWQWSQGQVSSRTSLRFEVLAPVYLSRRSTNIFLALIV